MKRVFIVHGWGGSPEKEWIPWLKLELEKRGYEVNVPTMPNTDTPEIESWVNHLSKAVGPADADTYFIGHSIGCQTILRYLEKLNAQVGGAVFVAGWFKLENLETTEEQTIARPWVDTPINAEKIIKVLPKSVLIISENDPFGAFVGNVNKFSEFVSHTAVLPNAGHIEQKIEPAILSQFENITA